ncbi:MAG: RNA ligase family protein [Parcubacteria group bacterium]
MDSTYHKIETLYERDEQTHRLKPELILKNRVYGIIKTWHWTEKIDGTNIRCIWSGGKLTFGGKTDNAQIHADLIRYMYETVSPEKMREVFPDSDAVLYGEGYGAGIQKGGGYSPTKKLIVFDVLVAGQWWLSWENTCDVAEKLGIDVVPYIGEMTLEEATKMVKSGFPSALGSHPPAEGMVGRTVETLFDKKGGRMIIKLKTKDF